MHRKIFNIYENDTSFVQDRTALLFLLFPSTLLILRSWVWAGCLPAFPVQMYQVFSLKLILIDVILVYLPAYMMKYLLVTCH